MSECAFASSGEKNFHNQKKTDGQSTDLSSRQKITDYKICIYRQRLTETSYQKTYARTLHDIVEAKKHDPKRDHGRSAAHERQDSGQCNLQKIIVMM